MGSVSARFLGAPAEHRRRNGKATVGDRRRYFEIARGSALECGALQDVLRICGAFTEEENANRKAMLTKLGQRGYAIKIRPTVAEASI